MVCYCSDYNRVPSLFQRGWATSQVVAGTNCLPIPAEGTMCFVLVFFFFKANAPIAVENRGQRGHRPFPNQSTSQQILISPRHRHKECQTDPASTGWGEARPSTKSVATQLSYGALKNRVRSKGVYGIRTVDEYDLMQHSYSLIK